AQGRISDAAEEEEILLRSEGADARNVLLSAALRTYEWVEKRRDGASGARLQFATYSQFPFSSRLPAAT
ncbi:MAG: hypothetical protein M3Q91_10275, partial [Acidobacteriota bacterium]|nr:hypothetical protein [Acidobacteriota bacterium]